MAQRQIIIEYMSQKILADNPPLPMRNVANDISKFDGKGILQKEKSKYNYVQQ
jgi:hypothetical protein